MTASVETVAAWMTPEARPTTSAPRRIALAASTPSRTPPDPISQLMLAVPMVLLYEVSIWCVRIIELRRKKADTADGLAA